VPRAGLRNCFSFNDLSHRNPVNGAALFREILRGCSPLIMTWPASQLRPMCIASLTSASQRHSRELWPRPRSTGGGDTRLAASSLHGTIQRANGGNTRLLGHGHLPMVASLTPKQLGFDTGRNVALAELLAALWFGNQSVAKATRHLGDAVIC